MLICETSRMMRKTSLMMRETALMMCETAFLMLETALLMREASLKMCETSLRMRKTSLTMLLTSGSTHVRICENLDTTRALLEQRRIPSGTLLDFIPCSEHNSVMMFARTPGSHCRAVFLGSSLRSDARLSRDHLCVLIVH